ncbi:ATP-grasp domain-containing protein [Collinsella sp. SGI.180]|uniref:ATP-grasp domain-containing protein n=1 Tax=Collinsella sp. SGI.180 TaxID=3420555 RepID=UPI003D05E812
MKKILLLGGPVFQKPVIERAKSMGLYVGVADISKQAPAAPLADEFFQGSIRDYEAMLAIAREFKPDAIASGACDTSVVTVARLCEELGLPGNSVDAALNSTDKLRMIKCFAQEGVAHPAFAVAKKAELDVFVPPFPYPIITKPTDSAGGRGVNLVSSPETLLSALQTASAAGVSGDVLVEECMSGPEVSVEIIISDGVPHVLQVTDKLTSGAPNFFEIGHVQPTSLSCEQRKAISDVASSAVLAVGLKNSVAHAEVMLTSEGPKMVELGARLGGGWITSHLIWNSVTGIDMVETMIKVALGEKVHDFNFSNSGIYVATKFLPAREGVLSGLNGIESAKDSEGVIHVEVHGTVGQRYSKAVDDSARFASVVANGKTKEEALSNCDRALSLIEVQMG